MKIRQDSYELLLGFVTMCAKSYLEICFPSSVHLATVIASDLISERVTWKAADFINLFQFVRKRQDLEGIRVMGNQLTLPKFYEMVAVYEDHRAQALEQHHAKKLGDMKEADKTLEKVNKNILAKFDKGRLPINDLGMGEEFDRTQERAEREGRTIYPQVNHQKFFEK